MVSEIFYRMEGQGDDRIIFLNLSESPPVKVATVEIKKSCNFTQPNLVVSKKIIEDKFNKEDLPYEQAKKVLGYLLNEIKNINGNKTNFPLNFKGKIDVYNCSGDNPIFRFIQFP